MKDNKSYIHALLDALILRVIQTGESREQTYVIPYFELAEEFKHYNAPTEIDTWDIYVNISVKIGDDEDIYETGTDFTVKNKTHH